MREAIQMPRNVSTCARIDLFPLRIHIARQNLDHAVLGEFPHVKIPRPEAETVKF
jgi:hypothetical protein